MRSSNSIKNMNPNTLAGILLLCFAVTALLFWEAAGREMFLMNPVLIAKSDIAEGTILGPDLFHTVSVPADALVDGAVAPKNEPNLAGKITALPILAGAQLSERFLLEPDAALRPDTSSFVLKNEWIALCTSALRRGDQIELRYGSGERSLGVFEVAFVKDAEGREVTDVTAGLGGFRANDGTSARANPSAPIHHIEIECEWGDYQKILALCREASGASLILIRKETPTW
ncbi:hypothetical protein AGMMS49983_08120 [Clostridia bacterium]|nr:hypothetical protein AGMMS49983_08120 [Clostridia bacterium]